MNRVPVGYTRKILTFFGFYVINQDEIGVKMTFGKFAGNLNPGLGFMIPIVQKGIKTKLSIQTVDLPDQKIVLNGNIAITISGNLNFRVTDPRKALLGVENYHYTIQRFALTTISDVLSTKSIDDIRGSKANIADEIEEIVARKAEEWGLSEVDIRLTDATLDESIQRAMARETEAHKEAMAIQIKADSDLNVAQTFANAAATLSATPGAMMLRVLQTLSDISSEKSTVVVPIPVELMGMIGQQPASNPQPTTNTQPTEKKSSLAVDKGRIVVCCHACSKKMDVSEVIGNPDYDIDPETPGQQIKCPSCETTITLPQLG